MAKQVWIAEDNSPRADLFLCENLEGRTRSAVKKLFDGGLVAVNGKAAKASQAIRRGDEMTAEIPEAAEYSVKAENIPLDLVYEDDDIAIVNKPQGMTVHMGNGNYEGTLVNALLYHLKNLSGVGGVIRPGIVHRSTISLDIFLFQICK